LQTLTVDETNLAINDTQSFAGMFTSSYGADGAGHIDYSLSVVAGASGLVDTATGQNVVLSMNGGVVEGRTAGSNALVFTVSVDASGNVTLDQLRAVVHPTADPNEPTTLSAANLVTLTATITDKDGDHTDAHVDIGTALQFLDDGPSISPADVTLQTLTVDETNLAINDTQSFAGMFTSSYGADGAGHIDYSLSVVAGASGLVDTATGQNVVLSMNGGVVEGRTAGSNALVFTVSVDASGNVTLDQLRAVVHGNISDPNDVVTLSAANLVTLTATITDKDGDHTDAHVDIGTALQFLDDGPSIVATSNLVYANSLNDGSSGAAGIFDYTIGADARGSYSSINTDFQSITLAGTVGAANISSQSVTWASENSSSATFNIAFDYAANPLNPGALTHATGTLVFDKVAGTYTVSLDQPINSYTVLSTSHTVSQENYDLGGSPKPEIVVSKLDDGFYARFTGGSGSFQTSNGDSTLTNGETFSATQSWVSISGTENGIASDTIQNGEVLNMDFYTSSPGNNPNPGAGTAYADGVYLILAKWIPGEDMVVLLKLVDSVTHATTTRTVIVDSGDIYNQSTETNPYGITGGDGVVIIESNDYNGVGEHYQIAGMQLLVSTDGVSGSGIDLNRATGSGGASTGTEAFGAITDDHDVIKIVDIGLISSQTNTQDTNLTFDVKVADADGDTTSVQQLHVTIDAGGTLDGTSGNDALYGGIGSDTLVGHGGNDIFVGGAGNDTMTGNTVSDLLHHDSFVWNLGDQGTTGTPATDTITTFNASRGDALDLHDLLQGENAATTLTEINNSLPASADNLLNYLHFTQVGADTVVQVSSTGNVSASHDQTIVLQNVSLSSLGGTTDADIIKHLLTSNNLKTD
ncbi:DUF5801 repeats-in-toxin domain-containing protein, partial [Vogesella oryzae]|uniref:DUF5801 repeats-in-toxin domain-containing protein n=1 Tax=Vogesella oryzae TaxID=1735285 RepID=UPI001583A598